MEDAWAVDCGLTNTLTYPAATLYPNGITGLVTFETDVGVFSSGDVGKVIRAGGGIGTVITYNGTGSVVARMTRDITYTSWNGTIDYPLPVASGDWSLTEKFTVFTGLEHLEGATVSILGDGNVFPTQIVSNGQITLDHACSKVIVGLPFLPQMQTLYLDVGEPTIQGKRKKIAALTARVADTRGLFVWELHSIL